ncbi:MAG: hypothetical protein CME66_13810 [Halobacteriovoraceae bacterium]|nr:hypothetical protein [Halobacteriovoraceae bacterium]
MKIEGILIHKTAYKERDLICKLLLRSGKVMNIYVYGGRGGGKTQKGSILETGYMLAVEIAPRRKRLETDIAIAKEYKLLWSPKHIRLNFQAFYLSHFYLEFIGKMAVESDGHDVHEEDHDGLFNVLSNAFFYLDLAVEKQNYQLPSHLFLFFAKLSIHLGIWPNTQECLYCDKLFKATDICLFEPKDGGFYCSECGSKKDEYLSENQYLLSEYQSTQKMRLLLDAIYSLPYKNFDKLHEVSFGHAFALFSYINYQFGFAKELFKSWKILEK